jgi:hypothetical protein
MKPKFKDVRRRGIRMWEDPPATSGASGQDPQDWRKKIPSQFQRSRLANPHRWLKKLLSSRSLSASNRPPKGIPPIDTNAITLSSPTLHLTSYTSPSALCGVRRVWKRSLPLFRRGRREIMSSANGGVVGCYHFTISEPIAPPTHSPCYSTC